MSRLLAIQLGNDVEPGYYDKLDALKVEKLQELETTIRLVQQGRRSDR